MWWLSGASSGHADEDPWDLWRWRAMQEGYRAAKEFTKQHVHSLPLKSHWKVYLEMADLAKRENRYVE